MVVDWIIVGILCLILLYTIYSDVKLTLQEKAELAELEKMQQEIAEEAKSAVKAEAGVRGVMAKDERRALQIANKVKGRMATPVLSSISEFIMPDELESLMQNPVGFKILEEVLEPVLQQLLQKATNKSNGNTINEKNNEIGF